MFSKKDDDYMLPGSTVIRKRKRRVFHRYRVYIYLGILVLLGYFIFLHTSELKVEETNVSENGIVSTNSPAEPSIINTAGSNTTNDSPQLPETTNIPPSEIGEAASKNIGSTNATEPASTASDAEKQVNDLIKNYEYVIFSKSSCQYCKKAKDILKGVSPRGFVLEIDEETDGDKIKLYLKKKTGIDTVPNIFIKGESIGGLDKLEHLVEEDKLKQLFKN